MTERKATLSFRSAEAPRPSRSAGEANSHPGVAIFEGHWQSLFKSPAKHHRVEQ